jgi:hypothetical protein
MTEAVEPFGSVPENSPDSTTYPIILWDQGYLWTFIMAPRGMGHDTEVTEAWLKDFYSTTQSRQQELLVALAKELGFDTNTEDD